MSATEMGAFRFAAHAAIVSMLAGLDRDTLLECRCYFGGGTAIVLTHGEYRLSRDIDFLCADQGGYRELRQRLVRPDLGGIFPAGAKALRDVRADQYGIRTIIGYRDEAIRFEIVREARIALDGFLDPGLVTPILTPSDLMTEKLLANADRGYDASTGYRDAIDLGMLVVATGRFDGAAVAKAEDAYGAEIARRAVAVAHRLKDDSVRNKVAADLSMRDADVTTATAAFERACAAAWPAM